MKKLILFVSFVAFTTFSVKAANPALTLSQEVALYNAISALDQGGVRNVDGKAAPFAFDFSAHTRTILARDLLLVTPAETAFEKTRARLVLAITGGKPVDPQDPSFNAKLTLAVQQELEKQDPNPPKLETVSEADMKFDSNPIPFRTQSLLSLLIVP